MSGFCKEKLLRSTARKHQLVIFVVGFGVGLVVGTVVLLVSWLDQYFSAERRLLVQVPFRADDERSSWLQEMNLILPRGTYASSIFVALSVADVLTNSAQIQVTYSVRINGQSARSFTGSTTLEISSDNILSQYDVSFVPSETRGERVLPWPWTNSNTGDVQGTFFEVMPRIDIYEDASNVRMIVSCEAPKSLDDMREKFALRLESFLDAI